MSGANGDYPATPLSNAVVTAAMTIWMTVEAYAEECLFGFARQHPNTGGLSWVLSTPVVEFTENADRARTESGRVYALGQQISSRELTEEGHVALRLLLSCATDEYPGHDDDLKWVTAQKMARHLGVAPPPRGDYLAMSEFLERHRVAYMSLQRRRP